MNTPKEEQTCSRFQEILEFWHKLEFFTPFDLTKRVEASSRKKVFWLHPEDLEATLEKAAAFRPPDGKRISSIHLFAGVFDIAELSEAAREICSGAADGNGFDNDERGLPEGRTCFARFGLSEQFRINFEDVEISTLPWAMGRSRTGGLETLSLSAFQADLKRLKDKFCILSQTHGNESAGPVTSVELLELAETLTSWARYHPASSNPLACLEINLGKERPADTRPDENTSGAAPEIVDSGEEDEVPESDDEQEIGILNSFYISDLELAIGLAARGELPPVLQEFLSPGTADQRADLYEDAGREDVLATLAPENINHGRWMSESAHAMSLMQQFAINRIIRMRGTEGLFSVNGPPGTGKTTLLRDIIADNLVARAKILAGFAGARDAFLKEKRPYEATEGSTVQVSLLKPELTGFGMVVASSNNAAVENISRDLPKRDAIVAPKEFGYLQTVAHKVAAEKGYGRFECLKEGDIPWGMVAAALGKSANRNHFVQSFFFNRIEEGTRKTWAGERRPQNIWEWLQTYEGPGFAEAKAAFNAALASAEREIGCAARYSELCCRLSATTKESFLGSYQTGLDRARQEAHDASIALEAGKAEASALRQRIEELEKVAELLDRAAPAWWAYLLLLPAARKHRTAVAQNASHQLELRHELSRISSHITRDLEPDLAAKEECAIEAATALEQARAEWSSLINEWEKLGKRGYSPPPETLAGIESDEVQIAGLWHSDVLAENRSSLTRAALNLHEAWLAEAGRTPGGFRQNLFAISKMLSGDLTGDLAPVWESLFMVVPVVSTTFASFARQFSGMGPSSLGWLFIDEAGQAVPQAAAGALMRAQRAVVIGDPLQIEPVFTLPTMLISALEQQAQATTAGNWSPHRTSVQSIADQANKYGATVPGAGDEDIWIGSPLRVHRRCCDPMFSLANEIAYQGKMVFGARERLPAENPQIGLGESSWIDVQGEVQGKQKVPSQTNFMCRLIQMLYQRDGTLPGIYVISPFKEVAQDLKSSLRDMEWPDAAPAKKELDTWMRQRIGTVHTFQGKEEQIVFMVLGADAAHAGAARWAASKPNLLNVALTRAKERFYVVGDRALWSRLQGFGLAASRMPTLSADDALNRITWRQASRPRTSQSLPAGIQN